MAPDLTEVIFALALSLIRKPLWYDDFGMRSIFIDDARSLSLKIPGLVEWPKVEPTGRSLRPGMWPA